MISNKRNKQIEGQVLLLSLMLIATVLTVFLSVSFKSTTETQITKLEEENQKALAAAEAGIEAALKTTSGSVSIGPGLSADLAGFSGNAQCSTLATTTFVSPRVTKDSQYTFYTSDYPGLTSYWNGSLNVYFKTETDAPVLEITQIKNDGSIVRNLVDPGNQISSNEEKLTTTGGGSLQGVSFDYRLASSLSISNTKLIIVRVLSASTKLGFSGSSVFPAQGKTCTSTANSTTSTKKVTLFQSYPQIPAEFFITSF
jgi:hypothetical protein